MNGAHVCCEGSRYGASREHCRGDDDDDLNVEFDAYSNERKNRWAKQNVNCSGSGERDEEKCTPRMIRALCRISLYIINVI